jgi:predicted porin
MHASRSDNRPFGAVRATQRLAFAAAIAGSVAGARAADLSLDNLKNVIPSVTAAGVTIYGTVDLGFAYSSHGVPVSAAMYTGADYSILGSRFAGPAITTITNNVIDQSKIGVKIEEGFAGGWVAIGKLETGFNPISGELTDACASLLRNNGKLYSQMDMNGDGSRCGQAFNGVAYGGVSNSNYGTLTLGRQPSLMLDGIATYDPMVLSYAFSVLGYSGSPAAGIGSTETGRWDNSVKYVYQYGSLHVAGMFTNGGEGTPMMGQGFGANLGASWRGVSVEGFYTREYGAVSLASFANPANTTSGTFPSGTSCVAGLDCPDELVGTVTNNEAWSVMAKYSFDIQELAGGLKDNAAADKLTLFAGFVYIDLSNPDHRQSFYNGFNTIGGYRFFTLGPGGGHGPGTPGYNPANDRAFGSDRIENTEWAGVRYEFSWDLSLTAAYYRFAQDSFLTNAGRNCDAQTAVNNAAKSAGHFVGNTAGSNCAGDFNQISFLADYAFNKNFDVYGGISYTTIEGGLASAFLNGNMIMFASGARVKF